MDTIFKFLPHMRQHGYSDVLHCCNDPYRIDVCRVTHFFSFPVAVNNSTKLGPLDFLL
jgi:hypothetical protein